MPTLKSLAKVNKKLNRMLRLSLNQNRNIMIEGVYGGAGAASHSLMRSDSSYNNSSICSDLRMNQSLGGGPAPHDNSAASLSHGGASTPEAKKTSSVRSKSGTSRHPSLKKKVKKHRS